VVGGLSYVSARQSECTAMPLSEEAKRGAASLPALRDDAMKPLRLSLARSTLIRASIIFGFGVLSLTPALAGCISDCRNEYASEVDSCHSQYDDPDDADDLRQCIEDAKDEFDSCKEECTS
jgi:hypothetical protein